MFLHYERFTAAIGWEREFEGRIPSVHDHIAVCDGFVSTHFLRDEGDLTHYVALRAWKDRDSERVFNDTPWYQNYLRTRPMEAYLRRNFVELYDLETEQAGKAEAKVALEVQIEVADRNTWRLWENELHGMLAEAPGFSSLRLWGYGGHLNRYMLTQLWDSREAILDFHETERRMKHDLRMRDGLVNSYETQFFTVLNPGTIVPTGN